MDLFSQYTGNSTSLLAPGMQQIDLGCTNSSIVCVYLFIGFISSPIQKAQWLTADKQLTEKVPQQYPKTKNYDSFSFPTTIASLPYMSRGMCVGREG